MKYVVNVYGHNISPENSVTITDSENFCNRLQRTLKNKFPDEEFYSTFINMDAVDNLTDYDENLIEQIENGDLSVPLVAVNDEIASHGHTDVETVVKWLVRKKV